MADAQLYGMDEAQLSTIINQTNSALEALNSLNNTVMTQTGDLGQANQSASGIKLTGKLSQWTADFNQVRNALVDLNNKAVNLRQIDINTAQNAAAAS